MPMKILVTGANGFIGQHLVRLIEANYDKYGVSHLIATSRNIAPEERLISNGREFKKSLIRMDVTNKHDVQSLMEILKPDVIIHLAGIAIVRQDGTNPTEISRINILGTHNVLAHAPKGCKFVFASSGTVYGDMVNTVDEGFATIPTSVYGATKLAGEILIRQYYSQPLILRFIANVGLGATHGVLKDLISKAMNDKPTIEVLGAAPGSSKPFIHVKDTARAICHLLFNNHHGVYNISNHGEVSSLTLAEMVLAGLDKTKEIVWNPEGNWSGDNRFVSISNTKLLGTGFTYKYGETSLKAVATAIEDYRRMII